MTEAFKNYLVLERGVSKATASQYSFNIEKALDSGGLLRRLSDESLSPKYRHAILAAGRAWAEFQSDDKLLSKLKRRKLPAAVRATPKTPLSDKEWKRLISEIDTADYISDPMRAVLGLMAKRGLRRGDCLRIQRNEISKALEEGILSHQVKRGHYIHLNVIKTFSAYVEILGRFDGWKQVSDLVCPRTSSFEAAGKAVSRALSLCADELGIENLYPHRLRRTYATAYLKSLRGDPEALAKLKQHMQWRSLATVMEYVDHDRGSELDRAAEKLFD